MQRNVTRSGLARKERHMRYAIKSWVNRLPDVPAFILGNGPSISKQSLALLEPYFTIGMNRIFYEFDPTILMWQDISLWNSEFQNLHNTQSIKVSRDVSDPRKIYYNFHLKGNGYQFDKSKTHILYGRGSTGPLAVQLAVAMGCSPIVLLGMECKQDAETKKTDFYGTNKYWTEFTLKNCLSGLVFVKEQCPVEIRNTSSDLWPIEKLEDIIKDVDRNKTHKRNRQSYVRQILNISKPS